MLLAGLLYALAYCLWYAGTPMGSHPVLDGKENLQLANAVTENMLPNEPFYRAPLYPLALSIGIGLGLPEGLWPDFARLINLAAWLISIWLTARLAMQLWNDSRAAMLAAGIWALYPVGLFFLGDPLDICLAIALILGGLDRAAAFLRTASPQAALASGFLLVLGALTRPQIWTLVIAVPIILLALTFWGRTKFLASMDGRLKTPPRWPVLLFLVGGAIPAVILGIFNQKLSGDFTFMPTQGAFNLWAANKSGSHGKYFAQEIEVFQRKKHQNPARVEAIYHYMKDEGIDAPNDYQSINDYWRNRTRTMIADDPAGWIGRLAKKAYYLVNRYEQYNNKTYWVHRNLTPLLALNPLGWGFLLTAAVPLLFLGRRNPMVFWLMLGAALAYAAGLILTYVSARFRLPLAPMLAVLASGWITLPWKAMPRWRLAAATALGVVTCGAAFTSLFDVREPPTEMQDYLLLGYAALDAGEDQAALEWAEQGLKVAPDRLAIRELKIVAQFNSLVTDIIAGEKIPQRTALEPRLDAALRLANYSPRVSYISGVYTWWAGERALARARWLELVDRGDQTAEDALTAYIFTSSLAQDETLPSKVKVALARLPENQRSSSLETAISFYEGKPSNGEENEMLEHLRLLFGEG